MIMLLLALIPLRAELTFNKQHGIYKSPFMLRISSNESGAVVRYTLDGSEPTATSLQFSGNIYVGTTLIVRAAEFKNGQRFSDVVTVSYIFPSSVLEQPDAPDSYPATWGKFSTVSGTAPADYGMDPDLTSDRTYAANITESFFFSIFLSKCSVHFPIQFCRVIRNAFRRIVSREKITLIRVLFCKTYNQLFKEFIGFFCFFRGIKISLQFLKHGFRRNLEFWI